MKDEKKLGVLLSSLNVVLGNSLLLRQSFGILSFKKLQQKRRLNYLIQEESHPGIKHYQHKNVQS